MSEDDLVKVFSHLDKKKQGFITYTEFCNINQDKKRRRTTQPPSSGTLTTEKLNQIDENIQDKIKQNLSNQMEREKQKAE
jgi:Ca2+-binding EF-hand superfamily protein